MDLNVYKDISGLLGSIRSPDIIAAIGAGCLYVWYRSGATTRVGKAFESGISCMMSIALSPEIAEFSGWPEVIVYFLVSFGGFLTLDLTTSLFADKEAIKDLIIEFTKKWLGSRK